MKMAAIFLGAFVLGCLWPVAFKAMNGYHGVRPTCARAEGPLSFKNPLEVNDNPLEVGAGARDWQKPIRSPATTWPGRDLAKIFGIKTTPKNAFSYHFCTHRGLK